MNLPCHSKSLIWSTILLRLSLQSLSWRFSQDSTMLFKPFWPLCASTLGLIRLPIWTFFLSHISKPFKQETKDIDPIHLHKTPRSQVKNRTSFFKTPSVATCITPTTTSNGTKQGFLAHWTTKTGFWTLAEKRRKHDNSFCTSRAAIHAGSAQVSLCNFL